jgi:hypothetical protein
MVAVKFHEQDRQAWASGAELSENKTTLAAITA